MLPATNISIGPSNCIAHGFQREMQISRTRICLVQELLYNSRQQDVINGPLRYKIDRHEFTAKINA